MTMFSSSTRGVSAWAVSLALVSLLGLPLVASAASTDYEAGYGARVERVLKQTPLIDGHNDLPWEIRDASRLE